MDSNVCPACKGTCVVENSQHVVQACPVCGGSGRRDVPDYRDEHAKSATVFPGVIPLKDEIKK